MAKTPPNTDPIVSDWLAANDDVYIPRNREKPVLTVLDGKELAYLDYHSAVQMGKNFRPKPSRNLSVRWVAESSNSCPQPYPAWPDPCGVD